MHKIPVITVSFALQIASFTAQSQTKPFSGTFNDLNWGPSIAVAFDDHSIKQVRALRHPGDLPRSVDLLITDIHAETRSAKGYITYETSSYRLVALNNDQCRVVKTDALANAGTKEYWNARTKTKDSFRTVDLAPDTEYLCKNSKTQFFVLYSFESWEYPKKESPPYNFYKLKVNFRPAN